jgi:DNA polymerase elongation subunit (family B)
MSYVDAFFDKSAEKIYVVERSDGIRTFKEFDPEYVFYYDDPRGKYRSIFGNTVTKVRCRSGSEFQKEIRLNKHKTLYESDINPVFKCLSTNYLNANSPTLHTAFIDIESDFCLKRGFAPTDNPFNKITAVTVYLDWTDQLITLAIPPSTIDWETAQLICSKFENTFLFREDQEAEMMNTLLDLIDDADVISGWNSEGYDIPYMVNRITLIAGKEVNRRWCLFNQMPKKRHFERYGAENVTYDFIGRVHLDYMQLYRKYTYHEMHSYSLDAIGEYELGERKVAYDGTLDQLYKNDFETFIDYNRQDVALLGKLDKKLKFLALTNELAHANTVLLQTTMGAVAVTEQGIINEAHEKGLVVPNRKDHGSDTQAAGAYVAHPKVGMHQWIGSIDLNSLYPSTIRALNMAPETIVGQLRPTYTDALITEKMAKGSNFAEAWEGLFGSIEYSFVMDRDNSNPVTIDWESGGSTELTGAEIYKLVFRSNENWVISANGTIFRFDIIGIIPGLLERWYAERKVLQKKAKQWNKLDSGIKIPSRLLQ